VHHYPGDKTNDAAADLVESVEVWFSTCGRALVWDGQEANLLDFTERHGVSVDSSCRYGGCRTCETARTSGAVHCVSAPDHEIAPGRCLFPYRIDGKSVDACSHWTFDKRSPGSVTSPR